MKKRECIRCKKSKSFNSKHSQVTIFIILALVIVGVLIFIFYPNLKSVFIPAKPGEMIPKECIEKAVKNSLNETMMNGGKLKPELYFRYNNYTLDYLCYTSQWYVTCTMQKPLLKQDIENEVISDTQAEISKCVNDMENKLKSKGYSVKTTGTKKAEVSILPEKILITIDVQMIIEKGEETLTLDKSRFNTQIKSNVYEIISIASSIQNFEASVGDSYPESYMGFYPNIKVQKLKQSDGTKVYIINDRDTFETLQFATRSLAWPPGYAYA